MTQDNKFNGTSLQELVEGVKANDRSVLSRAITLIESDAESHQALGQELLKELLPHTGGSTRIGITGVPGAGKSTFIESFGLHLISQGLKVAVLAVDPSSTLTKGSILGDKTRMESLAKDPNAFIRPSPSRGALGGVAHKTRETMLLFEAAGFDVVLVETVGVGQSEASVRSMVDFFMILLIAGGGDELQGIKRGVLELVDAILINKADGDNRAAAVRARDEYSRALHYLQPATEGWETQAKCVSALEREGIDEVWQMIGQFVDTARKSGLLEERRTEQTKEWFRAMVTERLTRRFYGDKKVRDSLTSFESQVLDHKLPATQAAADLLALFFDDSRNE